MDSTNLRGVSIEGCDNEGLTIDGIDIAALLQQHNVPINFHHEENRMLKKLGRL